MASNAGQITLDHVGIGGVLHQYKLVVPANQREYAWTEREVKQLFQDFSKAISESADHFLGSVVTIPRGGGILEVVDGQQRLATTALLLAAIRNYLALHNEPELVTSINSEFLSGIDRTTRSVVAKLRLNVDDNELFARLVTGAPSDPMPQLTHSSHELLKKAYDLATEHILNIVAACGPNAHGDLLNQWVTFLQFNAPVILLRVPNDADAYKMFETLNDRGLRVSQADLIKNYLFGCAGGRLPEVQSQWSYMRGTLESLEDPDITVDFLRHALIVLKGHLTAAEVYGEVQHLAKGEHGAVILTAALEKLATVYTALFNPEHGRWTGYPDQVNRALEVFNLFNVKPTRPLLLAIADRMSKEEASASFHFLLNLTVRLVVASSTRSGSVEEPLNGAANRVYEKAITTCTALKEELAGLTPNDGFFADAFKVLRTSNMRIARYYLRSLEMTAKHEPEPWFVPEDDQRSITLEHILPKKPEGNWPHLKDEDVQRLTNRLGNQVLLRRTDNSTLKSGSFDEKKAAYATSPYLLTKQVASVAVWDEETINNRQAILADFAIKAWPVK